MNAALIIRLMAFAFAIGCTIVIGVGVRAGEIAPSSRYPDMRFRRADDPKAFWMAVAVAIATSSLAVYVILQLANGFEH